MDSEAEFQLQPSSSVEALELLLGAGLDRVQAANLLSGADSSGQGPSSQDRGGDQRSSTRSAVEQGSHQPAQSSQFERTVLETLAKFGKRLDSLTARVEGSDSSSSTPSEVSRMSEPSRDWADRDVDERLNDYSAIITWPDEELGEDPSARPLVSVSESTARTLKSAFKKPLSNTARLLVRKPYSFPNVEDTKCPKLDRVIKQNLTKDVRDADSNAARLQALSLDAVAPLVFILEEAQKGSLTPQSAAEAAKAALMLVGNASAQMAKERRKKVTKDLNKDLITLAEDPEMFEEAAPLLFGASFEKMKDHLESLKCLRQSMAPRSGYRSDQFFRGGRRQYPPRGGGSSYRGRGGQRFHPYPHQRSGRETQRQFQRKGQQVQQKQ